MIYDIWDKLLGYYHAYKVVPCNCIMIRLVSFCCYVIFDLF